MQGARRSRCSCMRATSIAGTSRDRKSTRLNSSHDQISYAVFCLKKKKKQKNVRTKLDSILIANNYATYSITSSRLLMSTQSISTSLTLTKIPSRRQYLLDVRLL